MDFLIQEIQLIFSRKKKSYGFSEKKKSNRFFGKEKKLNGFPKDFNTNLWLSSYISHPLEAPGVIKLLYEFFSETI